MDGAVPGAAPDTITTPGGKRLQSISAFEIQQAMGRMPSVKVLAAATTVLDQLHEMDSGWVFALRGRPFSRSIRAILEYYNLRDGDLAQLVWILAYHDKAGAFFSLAAPSNDDGLKEYLLGARVSWEQVVLHYELSLWDPVRAAAGFVVGLGASFAAILESLKELFDFGLDAFDNPTKAWAKLKEFVAGLRQLSFEALADMAAGEWQAWQQQFNQALFDLDFEKAGFLLGKLAGDLWQLLTGLRALARLPGMTMKLARKFAGLFVKGARASQRMVVLLGEFLLKFAKQIRELAEIGYGAIVGFFEDTKLLVESIGEGALLYIDKAGTMLFSIPDKGLVLEGFGTLPGGFVLGQSAQGATQLLARVRVEVRQGLKYIEELKSSLGSKVRRIQNPAEFMREVQAIEKLAREQLEIWRNTLQKVLDSVDIPINRAELGTWLHTHMAEVFDDLKAAVGKAYEAMAETRIEDLAKLLGEGSEVKAFMKRAQTPLIKFLRQRPEVMKALGFTDEKKLLEYLRRFGYDARSVIGDLRSDSVLFDKKARKLISIDWTSGRGQEVFMKIFDSTLEAGGNLAKAQKMELARNFLKHTFREYALRQAVLDYIFEGWSAQVLEVLYEPFELVK